MKRLTILSIVTGFALALDCPADSAYHTDNRTLLPDGTPNPQYGQMIATGLCVCLGFEATLSGMPEDSSVTLTVRMVDNEPVRGMQLDIYHDAGSALEYGNAGHVTKGEKLINVFDENGEPETSSNAIQLLSNEVDDYVKVMAYSTNRSQTAGDGVDGVLFSITYKAANGHSGLPATITFWLDNVRLPGTSMAPDLLDVTCSIPDTSNAVAFNTSEMGIEDQSIPTQFNLAQNYPNPFNPSTRISFDLPEQSFASMVVFNLLGQQVNVLVHKQLNAGRHMIEWNGTDQNGNMVASGVYFFELRAGAFVSRKKMLLLR